MATKTQIGAVISLDGANKYQQELRLLTQYTKEWKSETDLLTSTFEKNYKSMEQVNSQRKALETEISSLTDLLKKQEEQIEETTQATYNASGGTSQQEKELSKLRTEFNRTQIELNKLSHELNDLPADNFINRVNLMKEAVANHTDDLKLWGTELADIGSTLSKTVTLPIVAAGTASVKSFADVQSAFTGVKKTVDGTAETYEWLETELKKIPLVTASSTTAVMGVAEAAGQLGVAAEDIPKFTKNIIMLADSTNITAEEGAVNVAKFMNIVEDTANMMAGDYTNAVERFGSSIVALGNNFATDEESILYLSTRLASAGKLVGLTTPEILGLATAMSSVGLTAEAGGTAMSQTLSAISKAVATGSENLELFGELTGMTADEFAEKWRSAPMEALQDFIVGLSTMEGGSEALLLMLDELGFSGIRQSDTMRRLSLDYDGLAAAVQVATESFQTNEEAIDGSNALTDEATKRYEDFNSKASQLKESLLLLGASIGESIIPVIQPMVESLANLFSKLSEMDEGTKKFLVTVGLILASAGPLLTAIGKTLVLISDVKFAIGQLGGITTILAPVSKALGGLGELLGLIFSPGGVMITVIGLAVAYAGYQLFKHRDDVVEICKAVGAAIGEAIELVKQDIAKMKQWFSDKFSAIGQNVENWRNNVDNSFKQFCANVKDRMSEAFNSIENWRNNVDATFRNLISNALNWGKDLINNLKKGIASKMSSLTSAISNVAGKISSYLHFSEPDVGALSNFHTWMPDFMQGLADGIDKNAYLVEDAISRVSSSMQLGGNTAYNYGGVVINLNVPQGANGQQLVNEIETELANRTLRRRAVFG